MTINFNKFKKNSLIILGRFLSKSRIYNSEWGICFEDDIIVESIPIFFKENNKYLTDDELLYLDKRLVEYKKEYKNYNNFQIYEDYQIYNYLIILPKNKRLFRCLELGRLINEI